MKSTHTHLLLSTFITSALIANLASAATILASFNVDPSSTSIDTTDEVRVKDWGYYMPGADFLDGTQPDNTDFDAITADVDPATNSKAAPSVGAVTITERDAAEYSNGTDLAIWDFTVGAGDGTEFSGGTQTAFGAVNGVAGGEDIFNITFNDIGAGTVTLYMAHTNLGRTFDATVDVTAADGNASNSLFSSSIGGADGNTYFTFTTEVVTTDPFADLSISIDSRSGGSGQFAFAGYTVTVPEPSSTALLGLGGLALILRRRR